MTDASAIDDRNYLREMFADGGLLSRVHQGYTMRYGQARMATLCHKAFASESHLIVEAPTGTGKSYAYLVPAIRHALRVGKPVLVATANIALQEQLVEKDLPRLHELMGGGFTYGLLKGRNNYLCHSAYSEEGSKEELFDRDAREELGRVREWAESTETGDVSELDFIPSPRVWSRFSVSSDDCLRDACQFYGECHALRAKRAAAEAQVIVCNTHLLCLHLAALGSSGESHVLPEFAAVVVDEAHAFAEIARNFLGCTISGSSIRRAVARLVDAQENLLYGEVVNLADDLFTLLASLYESPDYSKRLRAANLPTIERHVLAVYNKLEEACAALHLASSQATDDNLKVKFDKGIERIKTTATILRGTALLYNDRFVVSLELDRNKRASIKAQLVDVGEALGESLWQTTPTVILCSATLAVAGKFTHVIEELGAPEDVATAIVDSPFDYEAQQLVVLPSLPEPNDPGFADAIGNVCVDVATRAGGGCLFLFTSYRVLEAATLALRRRTRFNVLKQGDAPRSQLVAVYANDNNAVLCGTESLWAGIDVPGKRVVLIDRIPFPNVDDAVVDAMQEKDRNAAWKYTISRAAILIRQGAGRLIRRADDHGVVVLCDSRLRAKPYGRTILNSLPKSPRSTRLESIGEFLAARSNP